MIEKFREITNEMVINRRTVRSVYNTAEGRLELFRLLIDHGIFREITVEELEMRNYGIRKLEELGFLDEEQIEGAIHFLFNQPEALRPTVEEYAERHKGDI